jgi:hypothetical protein
VIPGNGVPDRSQFVREFRLNLSRSLDQHRVQVLIKLGHQAIAIGTIS